MVDNGGELKFPRFMWGRGINKKDPNSLIVSLDLSTGGIKSVGWAINIEDHENKLHMVHANS